jgi:hypothetical protein
MSDENTEVVDTQTLTSEPPAQVEDTAAPQTEPAADPPQRTVPWETFAREVGRLRQEKRDTEAALDEHRRQLHEQNDLITRFQRDPNAAPPVAPRLPDAGQFSREDVERAAFALNFQRDAGRVSESGVQSFGRQNWQDACDLLGSFNLNSPDFVGSIMEVAGIDKAHEVFHEIAQAPDRAIALSQMTPARRIAEITRIAEKMTGKPATAAQTTPAAAQLPARTVSRAPAPPPRVDSSASTVTDWRDDKSSDADFSRGWEENMAKRRGGRR